MSAFLSLLTVGRSTVLAVALSVAIAEHALAQDATKFPNRQIRAVVGFSAGSGADLATRIVGDKLSDLWKQPFIIENRTGAGGALAAQGVAKAAPDGHTLLAISAAHIIVPALATSPPYNLQDFVSVATTVSIPNVLVVNPSLGVKSVKDLVAMAKAKPGELMFSSVGTGSGTHFAGELFKNLAGIDVRHIPYRGAPEALTDVLAGRVHFTFSPLSSVLPLVRTGEIVALAVAPKKRAMALPELPTIAEAGVEGYSWDTWFGVLAPAGTPRATVDVLNREIVRVIQLPDVRKQWENLGGEAMPLTSEEFDKYLSQQSQLVTKLVKAAGIQAQ
jgi:tripartite-type tricarboxylate transporter receptor subunit TctC